MKQLPLNREAIEVRVNGIEGEIQELKKLAQLPQKEFSEGTGFKLASWHLHRALEGVFHIGSHILSRIPGAEAHDYKEIARKLGECGIVEKEFADTRLVEMAGYRNRLVHFYADITPAELYQIVAENLRDFDIFLQSIKNLLNNPKNFNLTSE